MSLIQAMGKAPDKDTLKRLSQSPHFKDGQFQNQSYTPVIPKGGSVLKTFSAFMSKVENKTPKQPLTCVKPVFPTEVSGQPVIIWFGHSSYFIRVDGMNILIDPVLGGNASPFSFAVGAYPGTEIFRAEDLPAIDVLITTHDHYDHLDHRTILSIKDKVKQFVTPLGVGSHLKYWGVPAEKIQELDWWQGHQLTGTLHITAAPARHFTGRGLIRNTTLWASYILKTKATNLYLGGDSGYDTHFKTIGDKYGPFDLAILESGQYNINWKNIHMMPEETVQAAVDLNAKLLLPVHWGKFTLALHPWNEPIQRVLAEAQKLGMPVVTPVMGEQLVLGGSLPASKWWG